MYFFLTGGEDLEAFIEVRLQLIVQYMPIGPDEEDCVLTMAKCIWRKQRHQQFRYAQEMAAKFDPASKAYDERVVLHALLELLQKAKLDLEVDRGLQRLPPDLRAYLEKNCRRNKYQSARSWINALQREVRCVLLPLNARYGDPPPKEILIGQAAGFLTDDVLQRELKYERAIDAEFDRAQTRLFKLKLDKRKIGFAERRRFYVSPVHRDQPGAEDAKKN
jgi:hypothetical protein